MALATSSGDTASGDLIARGQLAYEEMERQADQIIGRSSRRTRRPTVDLKIAKAAVGKLQAAVRRLHWVRVIRDVGVLSWQRPVWCGVTVYPIRDRDKALLGYEG